MTSSPPPSSSKYIVELKGNSLRDFNVDDSLVFPRGAAPEIQNITQVSPGHFHFVLRHRGNPWSKLNPHGTKGAWGDGDRNLEWNEGKRDGEYHDKSRAEMTWKKQPKMSVGQTWEMGSTVWLDPTFRPSSSYCNIYQPVFDGSFLTLVDINGDNVTAELDCFAKGIGSKITTARSFTIRRGEWTSIVVQVKFAKDGYYKVSVNGDPFQGKSMDTTHAKKPWNAKYGLYGTMTTDVNGKPLNDSIVEHKDIFLRRIA